MKKKWQTRRLIFTVVLFAFLFVSFCPTVDSIPLDESPSTSDVIALDNSLVTDDVAKEFILAYGQTLADLALASDLYPSVVIAQALLNSQGGQSQLAKEPNYNFFSLKGRYNDSFVEQMATNNETGELEVTEFRQYPSVEESFRDYVTLMKEGYESIPDYFQGTWVSRTHSFEEATLNLTVTFEMPSNYNHQLQSLIKQYDLLMYDTFSEESKEQEKALSYYMAKKGENLWDIARHFGITVGELMKQNNLNTSKLSLNQEFFVE